MTPMEVILSEATPGRSRTSCTVVRLARRLLGAAFAALLLSGVARAADPWEYWPEADLYLRLGPTTRLFFVTAYSRGKEAAYRTLDFAGYFDLTLKPVILPSLLEEDWQKKKYLWARFGYDHIAKVGSEGLSTPEERGIVELCARAYLPVEILVEGRARADLRWIGGNYSTRYRLRLEVNRDFDVGGHVVTPYFQAETFYDTRYDGWARQLYQAGVEIGVTDHFCVEPSLARQLDRLPAASGLYVTREGFAVRRRWARTRPPTDKRQRSRWPA
jgi:hypothetical protein